MHPPLPLARLFHVTQLPARIQDCAPCKQADGAWLATLNFIRLHIPSISLTSPTLDDVFISYTGHEIRDEGGFNRKKEHAKMKRLRA